MKRQLSVILPIVLLCLSFSIRSKACDLCSIYMGITPNDLKNSFSLSHRYRSFDGISQVSPTMLSSSRLKHGEPITVNGTSTLQEEIFHSYDLWGRFFLGQRWQLHAGITFADNYYLENDSTLYSFSGPGDMVLLSKYMLYNSKKSDDTSKGVHRILVGGGVKLPTGSYQKQIMIQPRVVNGVSYGEALLIDDPHLQAGTGSIDFLALLEYHVRYGAFGINSITSYRYNTTNNRDFRFANRFNSNLALFYRLSFNGLSILPSSGLVVEFSERDQQDGNEYADSGGTALFSQFGASFFFDAIGLSVQCQKPIYQDLYGDQLLNHTRMTTELSYYF